MLKTKKPIFFDNREDAPKGTRFIDLYHPSLRDLFRIRNPYFRNNDGKFEEFLEINKKIKGRYIFFPWNGSLIYSLPEELFLEIRTARNRNLINSDAQKKYYQTKVGVIGLSIGSNVLWPLLISGGGKFIRIADPDSIELTNLNRLFYSITEIGENKTIAAAKKAYELNPFIEVDAWPDGVKLDEIERFISKPPGIDILVDELDDLEIKIKLRAVARRYRIPVLMATNVGESVMIDIERFDLEPDRKIFHGLLDGFDVDDFRCLTPQSKQWVTATQKIIDHKLISQELKLSLDGVGKTITGVPQLGITSMISSSFVALAISKIAAGCKIESGRYSVDTILWKK